MTTLIENDVRYGGARQEPEWPLAARSEELRYIARAMRAGGGPSGVVLAGAPGVGKTRLAREALAATVRRNVTLRWAAASASARVVPLGAFASLVPGLVGMAEPSPQALRGVVVSLLTDGAERGIALGVDDAHLLDEFSAAMVHQLAVRHQVPLIVTVRTGEPAPDAITALWKDGLLDRLEVQPFSAEETTALVESGLGGPLSGQSAQRLYTASMGNALFLRHVVDGALSAGGLRQVAGVWQWHGDPAVSAQLAELVHARIGTVPQAVHEVLEALAFSEPLEAALLARLVDPYAVEEADRRGLITVEPAGGRLEVRLAHPVYGEVLRNTTGVLRARRWRGRITRAFAQAGPGRAQDVLRRAVLALDSDELPDAGLLAEAARIAAVLLDVRLAERLARAARDLGAGFEAALTLGYALSWQGQGEPAEAELAELEVRANGDDQRTRVAVARASNLCWVLGRADAAEAALARAEAVVLEPACLHELLAIRSAMELSLGRTQRAVELASSVLAAVDSRDGAMFWAASAATGALGLLGRSDELGDIPARGFIAAAGSFERAWARCGLAAAEVTALRLAGRLAEARKRVSALQAEVSAQGPFGAAVGGCLAGEVALDAGELATAVRSLREALAAFTVHDPSGGWASRSRLALIRALALTGDAPGARELLGHDDAADRAEQAMAEMWVAAAEGAASHAITLARRAAQEAERDGLRALEVVALHAAVCFGDRSAGGRLAELAELVHGPRASAAAAHAIALASDDGPALEAASVRLAELGAPVLAADAAAQAAEAFHRHGRRPAGLAAGARAQRLARACEGARTPALRAVEQPLPLTVREREIACLVAAGLSNREIAERLVVSVRTIEGHVYHACTKLDVTDRAGLADVLRAGGGSSET